MTQATVHPNESGSLEGDQRPRSRRRQMLRGGLLFSLVLVVAGVPVGLWGFLSRYQYSETMTVPITEYTSFDYPEDPSTLSERFGRYMGRELVFVQRDETHADFVFRPRHDHVATITFRNVDVSLMTPGVPEYVRGEPGLTRIALVDREWNRQQVQFQIPSTHVEVTGGDGYERQHLAVASLAKNCLNAGLWEVILSTDSGNGKEMYYHGWFTFPMGHYKRLWEQNTKLSYWSDWNWYRMEHWLDPAGTVMEMARLRTVENESEVAAVYDPRETIVVSGEQLGKKRTTRASNLITWGDIHGDTEIAFASFVPPGYYDVERPWHHEYGRIANFEQALVRTVRSPAAETAKLHEVELVFRGADGVKCRFFVGGINLAALPQLPVSRYHEGLYMPMGIGVPPFYQDYDELLQRPPQHSPYYSFLLTERDAWIDHHRAAIDGPVMHRDLENPHLVHLYLLSYERHTLIRHFVLPVEAVLSAEALAETPASAD